jgi:hypothetical protein
LPIEACAWNIREKFDRSTDRPQETQNTHKRERT